MGVAALRQTDHLIVCEAEEYTGSDQAEFVGKSYPLTALILCLKRASYDKCGQNSFAYAERVLLKIEFGVIVQCSKMRVCLSRTN
jgi:hypothetical protein